MNVFVAIYGYEIGDDPNIFKTLESAKRFVEDRQKEDKWQWSFLEDDETWYFTPADDDAPEEVWGIVETEVQ